MPWFVAIAFGLPWLLVGYADDPSFGAQLALVALIAFTPSLGALVATRGRVLAGPWRTHPRWLIAGFVLGPVVVALATLLVLPFSGSTAHWGPLAIAAAIGPPLGEELGWRGYLGPALRLRLGVLGGAIATGFAWALWHLPLSFDTTRGLAGLAAFPEFAASLICASVVIAWLVERSGGSLAVAILAHASLNLGILRAPDAMTGRLVAWSLLAIAAGVALRSAPATVAARARA